MFKGKITQIIERRELVWNMVLRNLKIRYKSSVLGFLWTLLNPLFMALIYLIFIGILRFKIDIRVLLTGIIPWQFFVMCLSDSVNSVSGNTNLVKKTYFPRIILPFSMVIANLINFLFSLIVLFALLIFFKTNFGFNLIFLPLIILLQTLFILGLSLIISCSNVYFRDTEHIVGVLLLAWFFLTPIIYPLNMVPERFLTIYLLNPMASIVTLYRAVFLGQALPGWQMPGLSLGISVIVLIFGIRIFLKYEHYFADEL
ncbi:MAG: ABC transporter permease [Candidatus Ratteibacteria bacterium]|nr:ABC transporter permease [Candidatus Ratteibacteria bacterium]